MNYRKTLVASPVFYPRHNLPEGVNWMLETAGLHGIEIMQVGLDEPFENVFDAKISKLFAKVQPLQEYDFIVVVDRADVLWATGLGELHYWFDKYHVNFVMSGEANCYPHVKYRDSTPGQPNKFRFLNSGFYMASWPGFLNVIGAMQAKLPVSQGDESGSDQGYWQRAWMEGHMRSRSNTNAGCAKTCTM